MTAPAAPANLHATPAARLAEYLKPGPDRVRDAALVAAEAACLADLRFELDLIRGFNEAAGDLAETIGRVAFAAGARWEAYKVEAMLTREPRAPSPQPRAPSPQPPAPSPLTQDAAPAPSPPSPLTQDTKRVGYILMR